MIYFTPITGFFSPFPHGTCSLSVTNLYLGLPNGLGKFKQNFTCSTLLRILLGISKISYTGFSPSMILLSNNFYYLTYFHIEVL